MGQPDSTSVLALDYAALPSRRRKWLRRVLVLLLIGAVSFAGWKWGPAAWRQMQVLYWQRQCMKYAPSADLIVYEEDPVAALSLIGRHQQYDLYPGARWRTSTYPITAAYCPTPLTRFLALSVSAAQTGAETGAVLFLHELVSPAGHRRLVYLVYQPDLSRNFTIPIFCDSSEYTYTVMKPDSFASSPVRSFPNLSVYDHSALLPISPHTRAYAGQTDPDDLSHFTVRYERWGQSDVMDGYLDDQDHLRLKLRNAPKMPSQPQQSQ